MKTNKTVAPIHASRRDMLAGLPFSSDWLGGLAQRKSSIVAGLRMPFVAPSKYPYRTMEAAPCPRAAEGKRGPPTVESEDGARCRTSFTNSEDASAASSVFKGRPKKSRRTLNIGTCGTVGAVTAGDGARFVSATAVTSRATAAVAGLLATRSVARRARSMRRLSIHAVTSPAS